MIKRLSLIVFVMGLFIASDAFKVNYIVADDVRGTYWNGEKTAKIRIYRAKNGKYYGKIEQLVEPNDANGKPKTDPENPKKELQSRSRLGMVIMKSFAWDADDKQWSGGTIYDPNNGKTYDGYMKFEGDDKSKLYLRGYVMGMTWLGRTSEWQRIN